MVVLDLEHPIQGGFELLICNHYRKDGTQIKAATLLRDASEGVVEGHRECVRYPSGAAADIPNEMEYSSSSAAAGAGAAAATSESGGSFDAIILRLIAVNLPMRC